MGSLAAGSSVSRGETALGVRGMSASSGGEGESGTSGLERVTSVREGRPQRCGLKAGQPGVLARDKSH